MNLTAKLLVSALIVAILISSVLLYRQDASFKAQSERLTQLEQKVRVSTETNSKVEQVVSLENQGKCAAQAKNAFQEMGFKPSDIAGYENHYDARLGKCFILVESTDTISPKTIMTHRTLFDAFEGRSYGEYAWRSEENKKYWEVAPFVCRVDSPTGEPQKCKTDDEFKELVKIYMGG